MHCIGLCVTYKATTTGIDGSRYELGQKRCPECELFLSWDGLWCPCCGRLLRSKPRAKKFKRRMNH